MGKKKLVAETGAGQHGVASATVAALFDMELVVFMGSEDIKRQQLNVFRMELLGAKVVAVEDGQGTLSDAVNKALQYWVSHVDDTHYLLGSALGPDPFPTIVACIGGGSNAIGTFIHLLKMMLHYMVLKLQVKVRILINMHLQLAKAHQAYYMVLKCI